MKILVISDSHGNIANLKHVLGFAVASNLDGIIHCGDWDNIEAVKTVLEYKIPLYSVLGNADIDASLSEKLKVESQKFDEKFLKFELGGRKIGIIHNVNQLISNTESLGIVFYGDTHRQSDEIRNGVRVVNPGALEKDISFAVYDTDTDKVELINEQI